MLSRRSNPDLNPFLLPMEYSARSMACQTTNVKDYDEKDDDKPIVALDEGDIALLKTYGVGPYTNAIKTTEEDIKKH